MFEDLVEKLDGTVELEIDFEEEDTIADPVNDHYENLVYFVDEKELEYIASEVLDNLEEDESSRAQHIENLVKGIDNLGLSDKNVSVPFEGACTVYHPLIMENAVKIQAKAEGELLPAKGPVRTQIIGQETDEKIETAYRIQHHMNWQLLEEITEFYPNSQKALLQAPLFGDAFKKNYFDPVRGRVCDHLVPLDRLVVNAMCESLEAAERITEIQHISEREMQARVYAGQYADDTDLPAPYRIEKTEIAQKLDSLLGLDGCAEGYEIIEQQLFLNLEGFEDPSGVALPYVVTIEKCSREVLAIRRNWLEGGNRFVKREWFTQYPFVPGFGFYNLGYIQLLGNFQDTMTAIMRSLVDSGSFANMQGGYKSKQLRVLDDGTPVSPGEFRDVEYFGDITKLIVPFNFKEPSGTLLNLLTFIDAKGQKYADSAEQAVADAVNYGPVGTTLALLDASTKFFATVFKRFHAAQKRQLKIISELNWENLPSDDSNIAVEVPGEEFEISRSDYGSKIKIIPVSDPNIPSSAYRLTLASQKLQAAQTSPQLHDMREVYKQYYIALGDENYEKYLPSPEEAQPREPMDDIQAATEGKPIKAFPDQDHEAHIAVKTAFLNDPSVTSNPTFAQIIPALQANIREHTLLKFKVQMDGAATLGLDAQQAAQALTEFSQFKAQNPLGTMDPKQLIAQAEMFKQQNEAKRLELIERKDGMATAVDMAELQKDIRGQNLDMAKFGLQLQSDEELTRLKEALALVTKAIDGA